jgi:hypothetical protein
MTQIIKIIHVSLIFVAGAAAAQGNSDNSPPDNRPPDNRPPGSTTQPVTIGDISGGSAIVDSSAVSASESTSNSNAQVTVNITPESNAGAQAAPVTNTLTVNEAEQPNTVTIKNTPTAIAPDIMPTVSCFKTASGSLSLPGFGAAGAAGKIDRDCVKREYIRLAYAMGASKRAIWMWCQQPAVWTDFGSREACLTFQVATQSEISNAGGPDAHATHLDVQEAQEAAVQTVEAELEPLEQRIDNYAAQLQQLQNQIDRQNAAAARRQAEREAWKQDLATRYLENDDEEDGGGGRNQ